MKSVVADDRAPISTPNRLAMAQYDIFLDEMLRHPRYVQRMERYRNSQIMACLARELRLCSLPRVLEVGIGTGLFAHCARDRGWSYMGIDQNENMVNALIPTHEVLHAAVPPLPPAIRPGEFDIAYSAFVLEHMSDGYAGVAFLRELSRAVRTRGCVALLVPDVRSMGMEFWNQDYTHRFPTTHRNVTQVCSEAGLHVAKVIRYRGPFLTGFVYWFVRILSLFFHYRLFAALFGRHAFWYSVYQYVKIDVLLFICKKDIQGCPTN